MSDFERGAALGLGVASPVYLLVMLLWWRIHQRACEELRRIYDEGVEENKRIYEEGLQETRRIYDRHGRYTFPSEDWT